MAYNRAAAAQYAAIWWNSFNPEYRRMLHNDCTNFVSQALHAGGLPMARSGQRDKGWWYAHPREGWSFSWAVANSLNRYLAAGRAEVRGSALELELGDLISYDWNGDGRYDHSAIITGFDGFGEPLVTAHTYPSHLRPWRYQDSPAFSDQTRYVFLHFE